MDSLYQAGIGLVAFKAEDLIETKTPRRKKIKLAVT